MATITLPSIKGDNSWASILRRTYFTKYLAVKPASKNVTLNTLLGINGSYDEIVNSMDQIVTNSRILFGVGNGGANGDNDLTVSNVPTVGPVAEGSTEPAVVTLSNPTGDADRIHLNINAILPLKYVEGSTFDSSYGVMKRQLIDAVMYNKYYTKLGKVFMSAKVQDDGTPMHTVLQVHCILSKAEAAAVAANGSGNDNLNGFIDELSLYFGRAATIPNKEKVVNGNYPTYNDYIQVVPFLYTHFDKIYVNDIPETGLDFVFEIDLEETALLAASRKISGIDNLAYTIS